ncbi:hypothetical protein BV898_07301 [Hypsibius exemplaris]|uniref:Uncharacterized protein n=1 Tax=Hypsibius exemplaris TaxID=2072580 RepID=A0A1W0WTZ9_HYPEX|nr:hypothetical protein BV898_07301 [Hypsibius exemplaris]
MCAISAHSSIDAVIVKKSVRSLPGKRRAQIAQPQSPIGPEDEGGRGRAAGAGRASFGHSGGSGSRGPSPRMRNPVGMRLSWRLLGLIQQLEERLRSLPMPRLLPGGLQFQMWRDTTHRAKVSILEVCLQEV